MAEFCSPHCWSTAFPVRTCTSGGAPRLRRKLTISVPLKTEAKCTALCWQVLQNGLFQDIQVWSASLSASCLRSEYTEELCRIACSQVFYLRKTYLTSFLKMLFWTKTKTLIHAWGLSRSADIQHWHTSACMGAWSSLSNLVLCYLAQVPAFGSQLGHPGLNDFPLGRAGQLIVCETESFYKLPLPRDV